MSKPTDSINEAAQWLQNVLDDGHYTDRPLFRADIAKIISELDAIVAHPAVAPAHRAWREEIISRAEQACRYALKYQDFTDSDPEYRSGFKTAAYVCEHAIRPHIDYHIPVAASAPPQPTEGTRNAVREALTKLADFASNMEDTVGNCIASYEILEYIEAAYPALPAVAPAPVAGATHAELVELLSEFENGDYQYDSLATEILSRFAHPAVAPAPRAWTDAQCVAAMREFSAQKGESHDAVWGQIDEQLKHEIIGEWRAILECAVAASAPPHRNGGT